MISRGGGRTSPVSLLGLLLIPKLVLIAGCGTPRSTGAVSAASPASGVREYRVYVANESSDLVSRVVFSRIAGARVEGEIAVGIMPADTDGPHGVWVSPDAQFLYVTVAHGTPDGWLWKFRAGPDSLVDRAPLGRFPATLSSSPDGQLLFVANFDLHGDPVPSSVSVVFAPDLTELARITTCVTPHGSRVDASGTAHYSACTRSDQVVELSLGSYGISRRMSVRPGEEGPLPVDEMGAVAPLGPATALCSPTWVTPGVASRAGRFVYVTCNARAEVVELDVEGWRITRRFATGRGPYNLAITPDGDRLIVSLRGAQAISVIDLNAGEEEARVETTRPFTHGVVVSPDGQFAFVTNEAAGSTRGTLDVFDLSSLDLVASVELRHQPGGIAFWRADPVGQGPAAPEAS